MARSCTLRSVTISALATVSCAAAPKNVTAYTTWDNCPPGGDIAHPVLHPLAGGTGTFADPITYAGDTAATPAGTIIYNHVMQKYFIMEDDCEECQSDWKKHKKWHFDLWMGPDFITPGPPLIACENVLTLDATLITVNPPGDLPVDTTQVFNNVTFTCIVPNPPPCQDVGNTCGNSCEIPDAATCSELAKQLLLTEARFLQLNPGLDCSGTVPAGTSVCMGGTCGG